ncbi:DUF4884 domain-containing protein [Maribellus sp. CM-23]|uniref:DUF4884 domain-containing protein n=1 Tax=Maribellus sp. CM-23 TaxID=2781026 RepID=UPI001F38956F|nr:DUF4884 domain-containing protein [Maribellus sp. CM-23]MCE4564041.1 DUF4884 domain-containing protein [Maribellus sp. CM-23]
MTTVKQIFAVLLLAALTACSGVPISIKSPENNSTYSVEYLFEHDGCKVYRFYDRGEYVYFTNCLGDVTSFSNDTTQTRIENHIRINTQDIQPAETPAMKDEPVSEK